MSGTQSTSELIEEYLEKGDKIEEESLEFKGKEKIQDKGKKGHLVKVVSAIANSGGGKVIIGLREDEGLQPFKRYETRWENCGIEQKVHPNNWDKDFSAKRSRGS